MLVRVFNFFNIDGYYVFVLVCCFVCHLPVLAVLLEIIGEFSRIFEGV